MTTTNFKFDNGSEAGLIFSGLGVVGGFRFRAQGLSLGLRFQARGVVLA